MPKAHQNDYGAVIRLTAKDEDGAVVDISAATALTIYVKKQDGTLVTKTAAFTNDGTDGKFQATFASTDLDTTGYGTKVQGRVGDGATFQYSGDIDELPVLENLA